MVNKKTTGKTSKDINSFDLFGVGRDFFLKTSTNLKKNAPKYMKTFYDQASKYGQIGLKQVDIQILTTKQKIQFEKLGEKVYALHQEKNLSFNDASTNKIIQTIKKLNAEMLKAKEQVSKTTSKSPKKPQSKSNAKPKSTTKPKSSSPSSKAKSTAQSSSPAKTNPPADSTAS